MNQKLQQNQCRNGSHLLGICCIMEQPIRYPSNINFQVLIQVQVSTLKYFYQITVLMITIALDNQGQPLYPTNSYSRQALTQIINKSLLFKHHQSAFGEPRQQKIEFIHIQIHNQLGPLVYFIAMNIKLESYSCVVKTRNFKQMIVEKEKTNGILMAKINQWNVQTLSQNVLSWISSESTLQIKSQYICNNMCQKFISSKIQQSVSLLAQFIDSIIFQTTPNLQSATIFQDTASIRRKIVALKNKYDHQNKKKQNLTKIKSKTGQKYLKVLNQYERKQKIRNKNINFQIAECLQRSLQKMREGQKIVKVIKIKEDLTEKDEDEDDEGILFNSKIFRKRLLVEILGIDFSLNAETNDLLMCQALKYKSQKEEEDQIHQQGSKKNQVKVLNFIAKRPLQEYKIHFDKEVFILKYLRRQRCSRIASYFVQQIDRIKNVECIYIKEQPRRITSNLKAHRIIDVLIQITESLCFLKEFDLLHRDLKPSNVVLSNSLDVKLIDFGSAFFNSNVQPPEKLQIFSQLYSTKFYNIFYSELPFEVQYEIGKKQYETHPCFDMHSLGKIMEQYCESKKFQQESGEFVSEMMHFLGDRCKQLNPQHRINPQQLLFFLNKLRCYMRIFQYGARNSIHQKQK